MEITRFGWWDVFNEVLYTKEADAILAANGGNEVFPVYRLKDEEETWRSQRSPSGN